MKPSLLELHELSIRFRTENGEVDAVKRVSFSMKEGETLAIVGESGSGGAWGADLAHVGVVEIHLGGSAAGFADRGLGMEDLSHD